MSKTEGSLRRLAIWRRFSTGTNDELEKHRQFPKAECFRYFSDWPSPMFPALPLVITIYNREMDNFFSKSKKKKNTNIVVIELDIGYIYIYRVIYWLRKEGRSIKEKRERDIVLEIYVYCLLIDSVNDQTTGTKKNYSAHEKEKNNRYFHWLSTHIVTVRVYTRIKKIHK